MRPPARQPAWVTVADAVLDGSILAFAVWTVLYETATFFGLSAWGTGLVWLPLAVLALGGCVVRAWRVRERGTPVVDVDGAVAEPTRVARAAVTAGVALGVVAAVLALLGGAGLLVWALATVACVVLLVGLVGSPSVPREGRSSGEGRTHLAHASAAILVVGLAVGMMFVLNPSSDDIYYVNRSVWVAEQGTFPLRDTMFGAERYPAGYGGGPVASIEGLIGVLAHLAGVPAAASSYLVVQPVGCLLTGWATWRLVRVWAPRRPVLVLAGAVLFGLFSATGVVGDFSYARMWQGKVLGFTLLLPVAWLYLTRLARGRDPRWALGMLTVAGLAFVGLTSTAVLLAPAFSAAAVAAALLLPGTRRGLVTGAVSFSVFPLLAGVALVVLTSTVGAGSSAAPEVGRVLRRVLGTDPWVVAVAMLALALAPLLARGRSGRAVAGSAALVSLVLVTPVVLDLLGAVTGSGPVLHRLLMVAPIPVLVGLLLAAPAPSVVPARGRPVVPALAAIALAAALVLGGTPPWSKEVGGRVTTSPTWKWHLSAIPEVRGVLRLDPGPGPVLLPRQHMKTLPLLTTGTAAVSPRNYYLSSLEEPRRQHRARRLLARMMSGRDAPVPRQDQVTRALDVLDVTLVCANEQREDLLALFRGAGYTDGAQVGGLSCLRRP